MLKLGVTYSSGYFNLFLKKTENTLDFFQRLHWYSAYKSVESFYLKNKKSKVG